MVAKSEGDAAAAIKSAAKSLDVVYQLPFLSHAPMEPINTTIHVRADGADVWVGTQVPTRAQDAVAAATGLPAQSVAVHNLMMGGAFGRRLDIDSIAQAAADRRAMSMGRVKLIWTREEDIQHDFYRPYYYDRISAGLDAGGHVVGWSHRVTGSSVMARWAPGGMQQDGKLDPDAVEGAAETPYDVPGPACGLCAGRDARHDHGLVARRRTDPQRLRRRELHRRARSPGRRRSRGVPPDLAARQPARARRAGSGGCARRLGADAAARRGTRHRVCNSRSTPIWRR